MGKKRQLRLKQRPTFQAKYDEFVKNTFPRDRFIVENVAEDNACFYRAMSNGLCYNVDTPEDSSEVVLDFIGIWKQNKDFTLIDKKKWGYRGPEQSRTARIIQQLARKWIVQNKNNEIKSIPGYRVIDMLRDIHDVNFTTNDDSLNSSLQNDDFIIALYDSCYSNFAANNRKLKAIDVNDPNDPNDNELQQFNQCLIIDDEEADEENDEADEADEADDKVNVCDNNDNNDDDFDDNIDDLEFNNDYICELMEKDKIISNDSTHNELKQSIKDSNVLNKFDRWGSSLEAYALSELFKIPIIVYTSKKFNHVTGVIVNAIKPDKNVRFEVMQKWGEEYLQTAPPIELLYKGRTKAKKSADHYMALYRKY